jgi:hypothetical protein
MKNINRTDRPLELEVARGKTYIRNHRYVGPVTVRPDDRGPTNVFRWGYLDEDKIREYIGDATRRKSVPFTLDAYMVGQPLRNRKPDFTVIPLAFYEIVAPVNFLERIAKHQRAKKG